MVHCGLRRANRKFKYSKLRVKGKSLTTRPTKQMQCWLYLEILWKKQGFKVAVLDSRFIFVFKDGISPLSYVDIELHLWMMVGSNDLVLPWIWVHRLTVPNLLQRFLIQVYLSFFQTQCPRNHYLIVQGFLLDEWKNS